MARASRVDAITHATAEVATVSLSIWAILEVVRGDNPFRRVLGGVVLAVEIVGLVRRWDRTRP
jgi:hypothetical protein